MVVRNRSVGIATGYGLDGPRIESRRGRDFSQPSRTTLGPTQPPIKWVTRLFSWSKGAGAWLSPPIVTSAEVKERVELYLYFPSGAFVACSSVKTLSFTFYLHRRRVFTWLLENIIPTAESLWCEKSTPIHVAALSKG